MFATRAAGERDEAIGVQFGKVLDQVGNLVGIEVEFVQAKGLIDPGPFRDLFLVFVLFVFTLFVPGLFLFLAFETESAELVRSADG